MSYWLIQGDPGFMEPEAFKFEGPFFFEEKNVKLQVQNCS